MTLKETFRKQVKLILDGLAKEHAEGEEAFVTDSYGYYEDAEEEFTQALCKASGVDVSTLQTRITELEEELKGSKTTVRRLQEAYLPGNWEKLSDWKQHAQALADVLEHALELDHLGEGSTAGWARTALDAYTKFKEGK